ncbi:hypothetical protein WJX79_011007 [Trebouxia sp. C0005]
MVAHARKLTIAAQQRHTCYYDAKHVPAVFAVNDEVLVSTSGLQLRISGTNKLASKITGPFKVLERIGPVAYALELPVTMRIHDVFHTYVSVLKPYLRDLTGRIDPPPPPEIIDDEPEWVVETILDHRLVKRGRKDKRGVLIKFLGCDVAHNMWQHDMTNCEQLVQDYWAGKPECKCLLVTPKLTVHARQLFCLSPPSNAPCLVASPPHVDYGNLKGCCKPCISTLK